MNAFEMKTFSQMAEDTDENRLYQFSLYGTAGFFQRAATEILISEDKKNAATGKSAKYLGKAVEASVTG